ncbi:hypothetical protein QUC31_005898, partial [Theobroma cacao]
MYFICGTGFFLAVVQYLIAFYQTLFVLLTMLTSKLRDMMELGSFSGLAIAKSLLVSQQCADNRLLSCLHLPIVKTALLHFNMRPAS